VTDAVAQVRQREQSIGDGKRLPGRPQWRGTSLS